MCWVGRRNISWRQLDRREPLAVVLHHGLHLAVQASGGFTPASFHQLVVRQCEICECRGFGWGVGPVVGDEIG